MTNFERYKDEILKIIESGSSCCIAVKDGKPVRCESMPGCDNCELNTEKSNCGFKFLKWAYEDDGEVGIDTRGCSSCKYANKAIHGFPCSKCRRNYNDKFKPEPKKTRRDEFLEHYPNANVLEIQPCSIDKENFGEHCSKYDWCSDCADDYWAQEVE